jgi:hypothetical protein
MLDVAGVASAQPDVKALGAPSIDVAGTSVSLAAIGSDSAGEFAISSAGEADAAIIGVSARSLPLAGDAAATVLVLADTVGGKLDFGLGVAAVGAARADASGAISLTGIGRSNITARADADSVFAVMRSGAGDVSVLGQSARILTFLGQASVLTASTAAANSPRTVVKATTVFQAQASIGAGCERHEFAASGGSAAINAVSGAARPGGTSLMGASRGFRAPPAQRRYEPPRAGLSGRLLSGNSGRILRG